MENQYPLPMATKVSRPAMMIFICARCKAFLDLPDSQSYITASDGQTVQCDFCLEDVTKAMTVDTEVL
jgi:hypothetical protein